jgi:endonuclease YncB( thermonuclease family)
MLPSPLRTLACALAVLLLTADAGVALAQGAPPPGAPGGPAPPPAVGFPAPRPGARDPEVIGGLLVRGPGVVTVGTRWFHLLGAEGIDEDAQCTRDGAPYACGVVGMAKLAEIANGRQLYCRLQQFPGDARWWGTCASLDPVTRGPAANATTINQEWVRSGWARAHTLHTEAFKADEDAARAAKLGVWASTLSPASSSPRADATLVEGAARVLDGNTLVIGGTKVRLEGIDAPEPSHICRAQGRTYDCGEVARGFLLDLVMGRSITCALSRRTGDDRAYGLCRLAGQPEAVSLNERMVLAGWALADRPTSERYVPHEGLAQRERRGMWVGQFVQPARWRQGDR